MRLRLLPAGLLVAALALGGCPAGVKNPSRPRPVFWGGGSSLVPAAPSTPPAPPPPPRPPPLVPPPAAGTSDQDPLFFSFTGRAPPPLAEGGTWIVGTPTALSALKGRVVYLQFAFLHCGGCVPMMPYLVSWHAKYAAKGLAVLYVDNGGVDGLEAARKEVGEQKLAFPFLHDSAGVTTRTYGVRSFPTAYVLDKTGTVVWNGPPGGQEAAIESLLARLLER